MSQSVVPKCKGKFASQGGGPPDLGVDCSKTSKRCVPRSIVTMRQKGGPLEWVDAVQSNPDAYCTQGSTSSSFSSYLQERRVSKRPDEVNKLVLRCSRSVDAQAPRDALRASFDVL